MNPLAQQASGGSADTAGHTRTENKNIRASGHSRLQFGDNYTTTHYHGSVQTPTKEAIERVNNNFTRACGQGQSVAELDRLREQGAEINSRDRVNCTPLHHAAFERRVGTVKYLLDAGADIHALDFFYGTPLCLAALKGHLAVVIILIEYGVNLSQDCEHFGTAAHSACLGGKLDVVEVLANAGADFEAQAWISGVPQTIVKKGYRTIWEFPEYRHLSLCTDVARIFVHGTPGAAAQGPNEKAVVSFCLDLEHGLSANEQVEIAVFSDVSRSTRIAHRTGMNLAMCAAGDLDAQILGLLLARGCDGTSFDSDRASALFMAVESSKDDAGFEPCIQLLLNYDGNIDARHAAEVTALMLATRQERGLSRAQVLIGLGASVNLVDANGGTALIHAAQYSPVKTRVQCVRLLCHHGADVNMKTKCGRTALDLAKERTGSDYEEVQSILLHYGARQRGYFPAPTSVSSQVVSSGSGSRTVRTLSLLADLVVLASKRS